jgi:hypothetical protein
VHNQKTLPRRLRYMNYFIQKNSFIQLNLYCTFPRAHLCHPRPNSFHCIAISFTCFSQTFRHRISHESPATSSCEPGIFSLSSWNLDTDHEIPFACYIFSGFPVSLHLYKSKGNCDRASVQFQSSILESFKPQINQP